MALAHYTEAEDAALDAAEAAHLEECPFEPGTCWECEERAQDADMDSRFEAFREDTLFDTFGDAAE